MPIKIILARSCIFLGLDFYASISWGARAEEICRTIWVKAKISNSGSFKSIKTIVRSCKCNLKLFKVRPSNACERKSIWVRPIEGKCYHQEIFFDQKPFLLGWQKSKWQTKSIYNCEFFLQFDVENFLPFRASSIKTVCHSAQLLLPAFYNSAVWPPVWLIHNRDNQNLEHFWTRFCVAKWL